jgi:hypothetical protein
MYLQALFTDATDVGFRGHLTCHQGHQDSGVLDTMGGGEWTI